MIIVKHIVSHRNGAQVMVAGLKLAQLGYRRGARVILRDPTGRSENPPWEFIVANDEHATLVCRDPLPPDWIVKGVRVSIEISEPLCHDGLEPRVETNEHKADKEQSTIGNNSRSIEVPELQEKHLLFMDNLKGLMSKKSFIYGGFCGLLSLVLAVLAGHTYRTQIKGYLYLDFFEFTLFRYSADAWLLLAPLISILCGILVSHAMYSEFHKRIAIAATLLVFLAVWILSASIFISTIIIFPLLCLAAYEWVALAHQSKI
ncbi:MAG: hypothetical protein KJ725_10880 [Gammaproteobacteria bacterium]|nr:hypothetical protein [Gammaproteobacteria bacterium]